MEKSPTPGTVQSSIVRLDPSPSKVFSWIEFDPAAPATDHHPACSLLRVRYRYNGSEMEFWPCTESEAKQVMNPGALYNYSIGSAFSSIIKAHKSGRLIKSGERQSTKQQREVEEKRAGRRWLA
jgi:hypothetical protein